MDAFLSFLLAICKIDTIYNANMKILQIQSYSLTTKKCLEIIEKEFKDEIVQFTFAVKQNLFIDCSMNGDKF